MENENLDYTQHTIRIKTMLEISRSTAYASYAVYDKMTVLYIPKYALRSDDKIEGFNRPHKAWEIYDLTTLVISMIEHEDIHRLVHELESLSASMDLDSTELESIRDEEYFPEYAKSEGNNPSVINLESKEQTRKQKERDNQNRW